ncbi:MAG: hypothetical protein CML42_08035 [Rhodobacteraceae bacterium]|nr:hypothetical protein [Paracoccaceae bacterium]|tara:strand:+ start:8783 stop:9193 length:411 start_codon:yes stop_codon:yes gene_type:complete
MVIKSSKKGLTYLSSTIKSMIKNITGMKVAGRIGKGTKSALNSVGKLTGKIPLAGGLIMYIFKQTGKGVVIVTTTADNLVDRAGNIVSDVVNGVKDLSVLTLNTLSGSVKSITKRRRKSRRGKKKRRKKTRRRRRR